MKRFRFYLSLFSSSGIIYWLIEMAWKQHSHWSMVAVAGLACIIGDAINEITPKMKMWKQASIFGIIVTILEYIAGITFNQDYSIWDYRGLWGSFQGQVAIPFTLIWTVVFAAFVIWWGDWHRNKADAKLCEYYKRFFTGK